MEAVKKYLTRHPFVSKGGFVFILALLIFGTLLPSHSADALFHGKVVAPFVKILDILSGIFLMFTPLAWIKWAVLMSGFFLGMIPIMISALILNLVLSNELIAGYYTRGGIVDVGWIITRDLANLAFIGIIIAIAISTILGWEQRGIKLLPKLIGVALIINFSKVIAGLVVDIANIVTNYFLEPVTNIGNLFLSVFLKNSPVYQIITGFMQLIQDLSFSPASWLKILDWMQASFSVSALFSEVITAVMMIVFSGILSFTLLIFAFIFLLRYVAIWLLVIFSPLAFAAMVLPDTAGWTRKWWQSFIKWCFMGVGPAFMLFVTAKMINLRDQVFGSWAADTTNQILADSGSLIQLVLQPVYVILQEMLFWVVIIILMWTGMTMTMGMNSKASSFAVKWGRRGLAMAGNAVNNWAQGKYGKSATTAVGEKVAEKFGGVPLVGDIFRKGAATLVGISKKAEQKDWKWQEEIAQQNTNAMRENAVRTLNDPAAVVSNFQTLLEDKEGRKQAERLLKDPDIAEKIRNRLNAARESQPAKVNDIINMAPAQLTDSRNTAYRTDGSEDWVLGERVEDEERLQNGEITQQQYSKREQARLAKIRVYRMESDERRKLLDSQLAEVPVQEALEKRGVLLEEGRTPLRMYHIVSGLQDRMGEEEAMNKLADITRDKDIANLLEEIITNSKYLRALSKKSRKLSYDFLSKFIQTHGEAGEEALNELFEILYNENFEEFERLRGTRAKELMRPGLQKKAESRVAQTNAGGRPITTGAGAGGAAIPTSSAQVPFSPTGELIMPGETTEQPETKYTYGRAEPINLQTSPQTPQEGVPRKGPIGLPTKEVRTERERLELERLAKEQEEKKTTEQEISTPESKEDSQRQEQRTKEQKRKRERVEELKRQITQKEGEFAPSTKTLRADYERFVPEPLRNIIRSVNKWDLSKDIDTLTNRAKREAEFAKWLLAAPFHPVRSTRQTIRAIREAPGAVKGGIAQRARGRVNEVTPGSLPAESSGEAAQEPQGTASTPAPASHPPTESSREAVPESEKNILETPPISESLPIQASEDVKPNQ